MTRVGGAGMLSGRDSQFDGIIVSAQLCPCTGLAQPGAQQSNITLKEPPSSKSVLVYLFALHCPRENSSSRSKACSRVVSSDRQAPAGCSLVTSEERRNATFRRRDKRAHPEFSLSLALASPPTGHLGTRSCWDSRHDARVKLPLRLQWDSDDQHKRPVGRRVPSHDVERVRV